MGDRTVSIPTPVSNEEADVGQAEWDAYYEELEGRERRAMQATGGGCVWAIMATLALMGLMIVGVM